MRKKHAYLVLAHQDFRMLDRLMSLLDDERNDIYIHVDRKVSVIPQIKVQYSKLFFLNNRIDARWGDYSLVEAELALFETSYKSGDYSYYHLVSGVDLPIKSQDYIHSFCEKNNGKEFIGFANNVSVDELKWRTQHYFIFPRNFKSKNFVIRAIRATFVKLQDILSYKRSVEQIKKGAQWCTISCDFVDYILQNKRKIYELFHHTYCPDEMFIQTLCWNSDFRSRVFDMSDEFSGCRRFIKWDNGELQPLQARDMSEMHASDAWFARKFSSLDKSLMEAYDREFLK